ncbi:MAG: SPOR domain-containing protein, partial [Magnetococcales bacterium]|nr:SPOR domain-containing protein [Magnetococcales bacterium]
LAGTTPMGSRLAEENPPNSSPKVTTTAAQGGYALLLGAFASRESVNTLRDKLAQGGFPHFEKLSVVNGKRFFRVLCGPYTTTRDAKAAAGRLLQELGAEIKVVKEKDRKGRESGDLHLGQPQDVQQPVARIGQMDRVDSPQDVGKKTKWNPSKRVKKNEPVVDGRTPKGESHDPKPKASKEKLEKVKNNADPPPTLEKVKKSTDTPIEMDLPEVLNALPGGKSKGGDVQQGGQGNELGKEKIEEWFSHAPRSTGSPDHHATPPNPLQDHRGSHTPGEPFWPEPSQSLPSWKEPSAGPSWQEPSVSPDVRHGEGWKGLPQGRGVDDRGVGSGSSRDENQAKGGKKFLPVDDE